jgi:hypothetical protein
MHADADFLSSSGSLRCSSRAATSLPVGEAILDGCAIESYFPRQQNRIGEQSAHEYARYAERARRH